MIFVLRSASKAISALVAGVAFCMLFTCMAGTAMGKAAQKKSASDVYSEADLAFLTGRYQEALDAFKGFVKDYPENPEAVAARYKIASIYFDMKDFRGSINESMEWLNIYPDNPLKIEVMSLLGDNYYALGDRVESFKWWITTGKANNAQVFQGLKEGLKKKIIDLIKVCTRAELEKMVEYGGEGDYSPYLYQRIAEVAYEEDQIDEANKYAMLLVRSSQDEPWISMGRDLLERVSKKTDQSVSVIRIGCLLPLSGSFALYGQEVLNGIELGMNIFNQQEKGRSVELVIKDTKGNAEGAIAGLEELVNNENVTIIMGPLASVESTAAAKKAQELGVPIITFTQKEGITNEGDMVFRNFLTPSKEVEALLNRAINEMGMRKFAIFYPDKTYGQTYKDIFREKVKSMGGTITAIESYKPDATDFADGIKKILGSNYTGPDPSKKKSGQNNSEDTDGKGGKISLENDGNAGPNFDFDAVFIPDNYQQIAMIAPQFPYYNAFNVPFLGTSLWTSDNLVKSVGNFVQGAIFPVGFSSDADMQGVKEFVADYNDNFQSIPGVLAANGYDTIRFIMDILDKGIKTRKDFRKELIRHDVFNGVTGEISFDEKGEVKKVPILLTVQGETLKVIH